MQPLPSGPVRSGASLTTIEFTAGDCRRSAEMWLWMRGFSYGPAERATEHRAIFWRENILGGQIPRWSDLSDGARAELDGHMSEDASGRVVIEIYATACPAAINAALGRHIVRVPAEA